MTWGGEARPGHVVMAGGHTRTEVGGMVSAWGRSGLSQSQERAGRGGSDPMRPEEEMTELSLTPGP